MSFRPEIYRARFPGLAALLTLPLLGAGTAPPVETEPLTPVMAPVAGTALLASPCPTPAPCATARDVFVDYEALGVEQPSGGEWLTYDWEAVTRPVDATDLTEEPELSLAVRLILSEIGADRLVSNRYGLLEAVGILYTVDNRLDQLAYNPENREHVPVFPGCGEGGSFASCINPQQYLGMSSWRALDPTSRYEQGLLEAATDVAVVAWWLQENHLIPDFTQGATNYTHRCGAAAYGMTTPHCDRHMGRPRGDVRGANPFTGPLVFRTPEVFHERKGFYTLYVSRWVDFEPWWSDIGRAIEEAPEIRAEAGVDPDLAVTGLARGIGFAQDHGLLERLRRVYGSGA